jgi:hypothetical protein
LIPGMDAFPEPLRWNERIIVHRRQILLTAGRSTWPQMFQAAAIHGQTDRVGRQPSPTFTIQVSRIVEVGKAAQWARCLLRCSWSANVKAKEPATIYNRSAFLGTADWLRSLGILRRWPRCGPRWRGGQSVSVFMLVSSTPIACRMVLGELSD